MVRMLVYVLLPVSVFSCMKTEPPGPSLPGTSTTTAIPVTTTTNKVIITTTTKPVTTTTTTCASKCKKADVELLPLEAGTEPDDPKPLQPTSSQNCDTLTVTCSAPANENAFMQFNDEQFSTPGAISQVVTVDLKCTANGWQFNYQGTSKIITKVFCSHT